MTPKGQRLWLFINAFKILDSASFSLLLALHSSYCKPGKFKLLLRGNNVASHHVDSPRRLLMQITMEGKNNI